MQLHRRFPYPKTWTYRSFVFARKLFVLTAVIVIIGSPVFLAFGIAFRKAPLGFIGALGACLFMSLLRQIDQL